MRTRLRDLLLGRRLPSSASAHERLNRPRALGAFGLDALSSVAYGPDEILYVLVLAGTAGLGWNLQIALAIVVLLAIVVTSYRQTIFAYPQGGGSYTVARANLGTGAGLTAAAALMVDYLTTVAVSVTAGVEALIALAPGLNAHRIALDMSIHRHYAHVERQLVAEIPITPEGIVHTLLVPIADLRLPALQSLAYARTVARGPRDRVIAVHIVVTNVPYHQRLARTSSPGDPQ